MRTASAAPGIDAVRARWRRWREAQGLLDPQAEAFGRGGLGRGLPELCTRLIALPADPELHVAEFDDEVQSWWAAEYDDPATGRQTNWGTTRLSTASALVHGDRWDGEWNHYLALYRHGGIEMGLGRDGGRERHDRRGFYLVQTVHRCWAALAHYADVLERFEVEGPFEVTLALAKTEGAVLANFAPGWAEPGQGFDDVRPCVEPNLVLRREIASWPVTDDEIRDLAFSFGAQIEDAWNVRQRRFLARQGEHEGEFDPHRISWR